MTRTLAAGLLTCAAALAATVLATPSRLYAKQSSFAEIHRGRNLVAAGDCEGCHTAEGGTPFAGGRPLRTPFGTIYAPNITPDPETGIGAWSNDQFYHAMHDGISADGSHLYPAFPYPWFTKVRRADVDAIRAFLSTVAPVRHRVPGNTFPWPLDVRKTMTAWNTLYFKAGAYVDDPNHDAQWNRGAYLVLGLGHCGACHTPLNFLGATKHNKHLQGGILSDWYAPNLVGDKRTGLGEWSEQQIVHFLKTGQIKDAVAYGPMRDVVHYSTSRMNDADLKAIAVYLKSLPASGTQESPNTPAENVAKAGEAIYVDTCSACHGANGRGTPDLFPALRDNALVQADDPTTVIRVILNGAKAVATTERPTAPAMPAYGWKLSDDQIAAVASYLRSAWGNQASPVSAAKVESIRKKVRSATRDD